MKKILALIFVLSLVYSCDKEENPTDPTTNTADYTIKVHGKNNCILLDNSVAARINLPDGAYNIITSGDAYIFGNESHGKVQIRYYGADGDNYPDVINIGSSKSLNLRGWNFYAFFTDWEDISTNHGVVTLNFNNNQFALEVDGKNNCILLDNSVAARETIPAGTYQIKFKGDAYIFGNESHKKVYIRYYGSDGKNYADVIPIGSTITLSLREWQFYAFFTDWEDINSNSGEVLIEFYKM
jgi:hypothetical protein